MSKKTDTKERMALIDLDLMAYMAVTEGQEEWRDPKTNEWTYCLDEDATIEALNDRIEQICAECKCESALLCVGAGRYFRHIIEPEYKASRKNKRKPLGYRGVVDRMIEEWTAEHGVGLEADDVMGLLHTDPNSEFHTVLVSSDKDMKTLPGEWYNAFKEVPETTHTTTLEADRAMFAQALTGDSSDGYPGCKGVGAVKATQHLAGAGTVREMWDIVRAVFVDAGRTPDDALLQIRLARILRYGDYNWEDGQVNLWTPPK